LEAIRRPMDQILQTVQDAIGTFLGNPVVKFAFQAIVIYYFILWLAAAYWAFRDMQLRSDNPILPYLAAALIVLFNVFFPFGVIVYRIIRPQEKIGEVYERNLAEEALLAEVEAVKSCPVCRRRVESEWIVCPTCRTRLNKVCASCGRLVGLDWELCAWCGRDFDRVDRTSLESFPGTPDRARLDAPPPPAPRSTPSLRRAPKGGTSKGAPGTLPEP
jgi:RNA polymerase subunit RPABC4/transcription elongation factor Spt4